MDCSLCLHCAAQMTQSELIPATEHLSFSGDYAKRWTDAEDIMSTDFFKENICQRERPGMLSLGGLYAFTH